MCGYCQEFEPTWLELAKTTTRLEPARVNIDMPGGLAVAELVGVINEGIPAVVLFNQKEDGRARDAHGRRARRASQIIAEGLQGDEGPVPVDGRRGFPARVLGPLGHVEG